ncbi:hypothetical protein C8Q76DRAFT_798750 [Earliella scabrosa]|nr:hypothetical protein C8Q76DRAFT_798750 [Earliella scabrosa]
MNHPKESPAETPPSSDLVGPYQVESILKKKRLLAGRHEVENGKSRKVTRDSNPIPLKAAPYFHHAIREDEDARKVRLKGTNEQSGSETERETRRLVRSKPSRGKKPRKTTDTTPVAPTVAIATSTTLAAQRAHDPNTPTATAPTTAPNATAPTAPAQNATAPTTAPNATAPTATALTIAPNATAPTAPAQNATAPTLPPVGVFAAHGPVGLNGSGMMPLGIAPWGSNDLAMTGSAAGRFLNPAGGTYLPMHMPAFNGHMLVPQNHFYAGGPSTLIAPQGQVNAFAMPPQVPLHLLHSTHLPAGLLVFLRTMYQQEQQQQLSEEDVVTLWNSLTEHVRLQVVEKYTRATAEAQMRANDAVFSRMPTQLIQTSSSSSIASSTSRARTTGNKPMQPRSEPVTDAAATQHAASSSATVPATYQTIMKQHGITQLSSTMATSRPDACYTTSQPSTSRQHAEKSPRTASTASTASTTSTQPSLDLKALEDIAMNETVHMDHRESESEESDKESFEYDEDNGAIVPLDKGKGRARDSVDFEDEEHSREDAEATDADIEDADVDDEVPYSFAQADGYGMDTNDPDSSSWDQHASGSSTFATSMQPDLVLMMFHKLDGIRKTMHDQGAFMQQLMESHHKFQENILTELRNIRGSSAQAAASHDSGTPATLKNAAPRTHAGVRKVLERSAKKRGKEVVLTPEQVDEAHIKRLKSRLQTHIRGLLKIDETSELFVRYPRLTDEQVTAFKSGDPAMACTPEKFYIDFDRPWKALSANKQARRVIIQTFQRKAEGGMFKINPPPVKFLTDEFLGDLTDAYVATLRRAYRKGNNPPTVQEANMVKAACARNSRMNTLFQSRLYVVVHMGYGRHSILFAKLSYTSMSGDETDGDVATLPKIWRIIFAEWQSVELMNFFWALDAKYLSQSANPPDPQRRTPGNSPRVRAPKQASRTIPGVAPRGLWRNCYNPSWLAKLPSWELEQLEIIDSDYDFTIDPPPPEEAMQAGDDT